MYFQPQYYPPQQPCYYYYGYRPTYPYVPHLQPPSVYHQAQTDAEQLKEQHDTTQADTTQSMVTTSMQTVTSTMVHTATQSKDDGRKQVIRQLEKVVTEKKTQVKELERTFKKKKDDLERTFEKKKDETHRKWQPLLTCVPEIQVVYHHDHNALLSCACS